MKSADIALFITSSRLCFGRGMKGYKHEGGGLEDRGNLYI